MGSFTAFYRGLTWALTADGVARDVPPVTSR
jgi:hypothetical protein